MLVQHLRRHPRPAAEDVAALGAQNSFAGSVHVFCVDRTEGVLGSSVANDESQSLAISINDLRGEHTSTSNQSHVLSNPFFLPSSSRRSPTVLTETAQVSKLKHSESTIPGRDRSTPNYDRI